MFNLIQFSIYDKVDLPKDNTHEYLCKEVGILVDNGAQTQNPLIELQITYIQLTAIWIIPFCQLQKDDFALCTDEEARLGANKVAAQRTLKMCCKSCSAGFKTKTKR